MPLTLKTNGLVDGVVRGVLVAKDTSPPNRPARAEFRATVNVELAPGAMV